MFFKKILIPVFFLILLATTVTAVVIPYLDINLETRQNSWTRTRDYFTSVNQSDRNWTFSNITVTNLLAIGSPTECPTGSFMTYTNGTTSICVSGASAIGNSTSWNRSGTNVFLSNTGDNVGIGTASPAYPFELRGATSGYSMVISEDTNNQVLLSGQGASQTYTGYFYRSLGSESTDSPVVWIREDADTDDQPALKITQDGTGDILQGFDATTQVFTIADGGNVGIGTTLPVGKLQVAGDAWVDGDFYLGGAFFSVNATNIAVNQSISLRDTTGAEKIVLNASGDSWFNPTSGNVGIGTTTPSMGLQIGTDTGSHSLTASNDVMIDGKLEVDGISYFDGEVDIGAYVYYPDDKANYFGTSSDAQIEWDTAETNDALKITTTVGSAGSSGNIIIAERADIGANFGHAAANNPTLYIQSADATSTSDYLKLWHDQTDGNIDAGAGKFNLATGGTNAITIDSSQNVGIGTTAPNYLLQTKDTGTTTAVNLSGVLFIDASNNRVGIGTATPSHLLTVAGQLNVTNRIFSSSVQIPLTSTYSGSGGHRISLQHLRNSSATDNTYLELIGGGKSGGDVYVTMTNQDTTWWMGMDNEATGSPFGIGTSTANGHLLGDLFTLTNTGNVGIGTTAPTRKLHVAGDANVTGDLSYGTLTANSPHAFINFKVGETMKQTEICMVATDGIVVMQTIQFKNDKYELAFEPNAQGCLNKEITERIDYEYGYLNTTIEEIKQKYNDKLNKTEDYIDYITSTEQYIISQTEVKKKVFK